MTTAIYPTAVRTFVDHQDYVELVDASHVNILQAELNAVEATMGTNPHIYAPTGARRTAYRSVGARLDAHEAALAAQQGVINQILDAEKQGWQAPALSVVGTCNPAVRLLSGAAYLPIPPSPVSWSGVRVDIGDMYVPNANVVTLPKGGVWLIQASLTAAVDWTTLDATQSYYNHLGTVPIPIATQRLGFYLYVGGALKDYEFSLTHWIPSSERPINPSLSMNILVGIFDTFSSGTQVQLKTDQYYGRMSAASVTMSAAFQQTVAGVS